MSKYGKPKENLVGRTFGKLKVLDFAPRENFKRITYVCQCECGNIVNVAGSRLRSGHTKSCGCWNKSHPPNKTHGLSRTRLYEIHRSMIQRCHYQKAINYKDYGGRGIEVCKEWRESFENFYNWAINNGYEEHLTIDRIDVNSNYEPSNCRWKDYYFQENNRRNNRKILFRGEIHTVAEWCRILGYKPTTIHSRIAHGWTWEKAFSTPVQVHQRKTNKIS